MKQAELSPPAIDDDRRRHRRIQVLLSVQVDAGAQPRVGRMTELSRKGARVQLAAPLPVGRVVIRRAGVELGARIAWVRGDAVGLEFDRAMDERSFLQLRRGGS
jgi:hypothetical protein